MKTFFICLFCLMFAVACKKDPAEGPKEEIQKVSQPAQAAEQAIKVLDLKGFGASCRLYKWKNRGAAPEGYITGLLKVYARSICKKSTWRELISADWQPSTKDAVQTYSPELAKLKTYSENGESATFRHSFVILTGLGMRETSGKYCVGRDASAANVTAENAEAGLFQTSYNARRANPVLPMLFDSYKTGKIDCFKDVFSSGVKCSSDDAKNWGSGEGVEFQKISKNCPAFATEFAALTLRAASNHYGPLVRKEAEVRAECDEMYYNLERTLLNNPSLCASL